RGLTSVTGQRKHLGAAGGAVRDRDGARTRPRCGGGKGDGDGATGSARQSRATIIGLGKITARYNASDSQGRTTGVRQDGILGSAGGVDDLADKGQTRGQKRYRWGGSTVTGHQNGLRRVDSVVRDGDSAVAVAVRRWRERYVNGAGEPCQHCSPAVVGLGEVPSDTHASYVQRGAPGITERDALRQTGGAYRRAGKGKCCGRENYHGTQLSGA